MASDGRTGKGGIFYGWYIVAAVFFMVFVSIGFRQSYGVFVVTWESEYGLDSRGFLSNVASAGWVVNGLAQPVVGGLADRYGARVVAAVSLAVLGASTLAMAFSFNVWMLAFFFASFASFSNAGAMFTPVTPLIARWFVRKRRSGAEHHHRRRLRGRDADDPVRHLPAEPLQLARIARRRRRP